MTSSRSRSISRGSFDEASSRSRSPSSGHEVSPESESDRKISRLDRDYDKDKEKSRSRSRSPKSRSRKKRKSRRSRSYSDSSYSRSRSRERRRSKKSRRERESKHKKSSKSSSTKSKWPEGKLFPNIYERPIGPRTGIGYPEADVIELRFIVPKCLSGSIIGKRGDYVAKLRKDFQIGIGIPDAPNNELERICVIRGASVRNVIDCLCAIADYPLKKEMNYALYLQKHQTQMRLLFHQSVCGAIIGKSGTRIQEIKNISNALVKVYSTSCPNSSDRVAKITGTVTELRDCLALIFRFIGDVQCSGEEKNYDGSLDQEDAVHTVTEEFKEQYGGWKRSECDEMGDGSGSGGKRMKDRSQAGPEVEKDRHGKSRLENLTEKSKAILMQSWNFRNGGRNNAASFGSKKDYFDQSNITGSQYQGENSMKLKILVVNFFFKISCSLPFLLNNNFSHTLFPRNIYEKTGSSLGYNSQQTNPNQNYYSQNQNYYHNQNYNQDYNNQYQQQQFTPNNQVQPMNQHNGYNNQGNYNQMGQQYDNSNYNHQQWQMQNQYSNPNNQGQMLRQKHRKKRRSQSTSSSSSSSSSTSDSSSDSDTNRYSSRHHKKSKKHKKHHKKHLKKSLDSYVSSNYVGNNVKAEFVAGYGARGRHDEIYIPKEAISKLEKLRKKKKKKSKYESSDEDAPAYEGPNTMGPNRANYKKQHPLTAIDLKRMKK